MQESRREIDIMVATHVTEPRERACINIFLDSVVVAAGHADAVTQAGPKAMQLLSNGATSENHCTQLTESGQKNGGIPDNKLKWVKSMVKQATEYDALYPGLEMKQMILADLVGPNNIKARVGLDRLKCSASVSRLFFGRTIPLTVALINPCAGDTESQLWWR